MFDLTEDWTWNSVRFPDAGHGESFKICSWGPIGSPSESPGTSRTRMSNTFRFLKWMKPGGSSSARSIQDKHPTWAR